MRQPASVAATLERTDMSEEDEFELEPIEILELPLDAWHRDKGARMVEFAGYHMPIQYEGIMAEHIWTRDNAGLFDVSHMGQLMLTGDGVAEALEAIIHGDHRSSRVVGKKIEEIVLPEGARIGCVVRGDEVIMAHHDTIVQADDHVILFITDRRHVDQVEKLFLGETSGRR